MNDADMKHIDRICNAKAIVCETCRKCKKDTCDACPVSSLVDTEIKRMVDAAISCYNLSK